MATTHLINTKRKIHFLYKINLLSQFIFFNQKKKGWNEKSTSGEGKRPPSM